MLRKHVPQRTCIGCGETSDKRALIRIVRTPDGSIEVDLTGKKPGRGAYLCRKAICWQKALAKGSVGRVLKATVSTDGDSRLQDQLHLLQLEERLSDSEETAP
jgi:predicted RNA-binding protein YlxR (DUF448 family)